MTIYDIEAIFLLFYFIFIFIFFILFYFFFAELYNQQMISTESWKTC